MKIVRYFFVGGAATAVDLSLFALLVHGFGLPYLPVGATTFIIATALNYVLSIYFVFESGARFRRPHEVALVFAVSGVGLLLNQAILYIGVEMFSLVPIVAKLFATGIVFFWNYSARAYFVFRPQPEDAR